MVSIRNEKILICLKKIFSPFEEEGLFNIILQYQETKEFTFLEEAVKNQKRKYNFVKEEGDDDEFKDLCETVFNKIKECNDNNIDINKNEVYITNISLPSRERQKIYQKRFLKEFKLSICFIFTKIRIAKIY